MKTSRTIAILAASCMSVMTLSASAAPLVYYAVQGRITGGSATFGSTVTVSTGQSVDIRLLASFAPIGTVHGTFTISGVTSADGINNMPMVDITRTSTNQITGSFVPTLLYDTSADPNDPDTWITSTYAGSLGSGWNRGIGNSMGTISLGGDLKDIKAIRAPGSLAYTSTSLVTFRTTYSVRSVTGTASTFQMTVTDGAAGFRVHVNDQLWTLGEPFLPTTTTEAGADPYFRLDALTLVGPPTVSSAPPVFTSLSGLQPGNAGIDAALDLIYPINLQPHLQTFTIADSMITDDSPASIRVTLGPGALSGANAPLQGHMSIVGRNIIISGSYLDAQSLVGTYSIPLILTDDRLNTLTGNGTFALQIVPEPAVSGLVGIGGLWFLRRRGRK